MALIGTVCFLDLLIFNVINWLLYVNISLFCCFFSIRSFGMYSFVVSVVHSCGLFSEIVQLQKRNTHIIFLLLFFFSFCFLCVFVYRLFLLHSAANAKKCPNTSAFQRQSQVHKILRFIHNTRIMMFFRFSLICCKHILRYSLYFFCSLSLSVCLHSTVQKAYTLYVKNVHVKHWKEIALASMRIVAVLNFNPIFCLCCASSQFSCYPILFFSSFVGNFFFFVNFQLIFRFGFVHLNYFELYYCAHSIVLITFWRSKSEITSLRCCIS